MRLENRCSRPPTSRYWAESTRMALPDTHRKKWAGTLEGDWLLNRGPHGLKFNWGDHRWFKSDLQLLRDFIADQVGADGEFEARLRVAALEALEIGSVEPVRRGIQVLSVIGLTDDLPRVAQFLQHPDEGVCGDAQSCLFEMKMRLR